MSEKVPAIYLVNGNDEFAIARFLDGLIARLGDDSIQAMNLTRLDGRIYSLDDLMSVAAAMPFLASHRLVILEHPTARLEQSKERPDSSEERSASSTVQLDSSKTRSEITKIREKFFDALGRIPISTLLVLVEYRILTDAGMRKKNKLHWMEEKIFALGEKAQIKRFDLPNIGDMPRWILAKAKEHGGQFTRDAAVELVNLVGDEPRRIDQEIQKLLVYVNYRRPVEKDDVHLLTADTHEGNIFNLVDALANRNVKSAMGMLERLLEQDEPREIFAMIVRQYRLLLQAREIIDRGGKPVDMVNEVVERDNRKVHPYVADKIFPQAMRFSLPVLELIYHRLLETDESMKTSQMPGDLALETLVVSLGNIHPVHTDPEVVW